MSRDVYVGRLRLRPTRQMQRTPQSVQKIAFATSGPYPSDERAERLKACALDAASAGERVHIARLGRLVLLHALVFGFALLLYLTLTFCKGVLVLGQKYLDVCSGQRPANALGRVRRRSVTQNNQRIGRTAAGEAADWKRKVRWTIGKRKPVTNVLTRKRRSR